MIGLATAMAALLGLALYEVLDDDRDDADTDGDEGEAVGGAADDVSATGLGDLLAIASAEGPDPAPAASGGVMAFPDPDDVVGGPADDRIAARDTGDVIKGFRGDDRIDGGDGRDLIFGGLGDDQMDGGAGGDTVLGGSGQESSTGGTGADLLLGGGGSDFLVGDEGADTIVGGAGADRLVGIEAFGDLAFTQVEAAGDVIVGGDGDDVIAAGDADSIFAGSGADTVSAGDWIEGDRTAVIYDFDPSVDRLEILSRDFGDAVLDVRDVAGGDTVLVLDGAAVVRLVGVADLPLDALAFRPF